MTSTGRRLLAAVVTVLTGAAMLLAILAHNASLVNSSGFADRAVSVVQAGPVRALIVDTISGRVLAAVGNQATVRPLVQDAVQQALSNETVRSEVRAAAESLQSQLVSGHATTLTLALPSVSSKIAAEIQSRSPQLAAAVARAGTITVVDVPIPHSAEQGVNDVSQLGRDHVLVIVLTIALGALALLLSTDRRRTLIGLGLGAVVSGLLAAAIYLAGRGLVLNQFSSQAARTAAGTAWSVYLGGLETIGLVLAGAGALVTIVAVLAGATGSARAQTRSWSASASPR